MIDELLEIFDLHESDRPRRTGVAVGEVVENLDLTGLGRIKVSFAWLPDVEPWARLCAPVAGDGCGWWAVPQVGDEVLVAFEGGDVSQPYVLGGLWSMSAPPPIDLPTESRTKQVVKTPTGHSITIDDVVQSIVVEHALGHKMEIGPDGIELATAQGLSSITLSAAGEVTIKGTISVEVSAPKVKADGTVSAEVRSSGSLTLEGGASCTVKAATVAIN